MRNLLVFPLRACQAGLLHHTPLWTLYPPCVFPTHTEPGSTSALFWQWTSAASAPLNTCNLSGLMVNYFGGVKSPKTKVVTLRKTGGAAGHEICQVVPSNPRWVNAAKHGQHKEEKSPSFSFPGGSYLSFWISCFSWKDRLLPQSQPDFIQRCKNKPGINNG